MSDQEKKDFSIRIGGDVGDNAVIGDFSHNKGDINSKNRSTEKDETKEEAFIRLTNEFLELIEKEGLPSEVTEEPIELVKANQKLVESGNPSKIIMNSLKNVLDQMKRFIPEQSPLLTNIGSISQIISLFQ